MKKYSIKYMFFFLPFIIAVCIELFILPIDYFTFRAWEALSVRRSFGILKGPFYPNMVIFKTEEGGDLAPHSSCSIKKKNVMWITDRYGYRKANTSLKRYPVIIVGDSNLAGAGLTQDEMFSEILKKRLRMDTYPLAPESLKDIFEHGFLKQSPPDIIILESIERSILSGNYRIPIHKGFGSLPLWQEVILKIQLNESFQSVAIILDRTFKANMINYLRAHINSNSPDIKDSNESNCPILFLQGTGANKDIPVEKLNAVAYSIKKYSDYFTSKGIRFIFLPIPNKENIYYKYLGTKKPVFLENLIKKLNELNVEVVDTQRAFDYMTAKTSSSLYHRDDTHWNAEGVKVAAELLKELIRKKPQRVDRAD